MANVTLYLTPTGVTEAEQEGEAMSNAAPLTCFLASFYVDRMRTTQTTLRIPTL